MRVTQETKEETRHRILTAARKLFSDKGLENTTTREIAVEAKIAAGTLFNYFPNKEAVAMVFVGDALSEAKADFVARRRGDESLEEDCFAHAMAGFRRLTPLRHSIRALIDNALGPFSSAQANTSADLLRTDHLETLAQLLMAHSVAVPLSPVAIHLYWTLYIGALSFWAADQSPNQEQTLAVLDESMRLFVASIRTTVERREDSNGLGTR
jgi:AcrR family transcriptional regulator